MEDEEAHHPQRLLHHLIEMRVVHVGAVLPHGEFIFVCGARLDGRLIHSGNPIHGIGKNHSVPVHGGRLGQAVLHVDPDTVPFDCFDGRSGRRAVIAPAIDFQAAGEFPYHRLGDQMEGLEAVFPTPRQGRSVRGDHGCEAAIAAGPGGGLPLSCDEVSWTDQSCGAGGNCGGTGEQYFSSRDHGFSYGSAALDCDRFVVLSRSVRRMDGISGRTENDPPPSRARSISVRATQ